MVRQIVRVEKRTLMVALDSILNYVDGFHAANSLTSSTLPFAAEAAWSTGKWEQLERILSSSPAPEAISFVDFNVGVGRALLALRHKDVVNFKAIIVTLREALAAELSPSTTASIQACHDHLVKLHALYELEAVSGTNTTERSEREVILDNLDRRLDIIGAYTSDKQYLLGVRRATMSLSRYATLNHKLANSS
jgi:serine/threonine-protein kinase ATR